jgi:exonuclease III
LAKIGIQLNNIVRLPSGRAIAATFNGIRIVNIYAPSGAANKQHREQFFNKELTYLLMNNQTDLIIAGDFNCILDNTDATGTNNHSRALLHLTRGLNLTDAWSTNNRKKIYTHYTPTGASRLDRFYITNNIHKNKKHIETVAAAFTDHFAVILHMTTDIQQRPRGKNQWKMNVALLKNTTFQEALKEKWVQMQ